MSFSILILTFNEEANLPDCLASVGWCDDVAVLDSGSTDRTEEIAKQHGAAFYTRPFDNFAAQRNHGLDAIPFKHDWVFHLDADERMTGALRDECERAISANIAEAFAVASQMMLMGRWIRRASGYPVYQTRLAKRDTFRFEQRGHGQREPSTIHPEYLRSPLPHYTFSKGWSDWIERHNRYSTDEAAAELAEEQVEATATAKPSLFTANPLARRRALKRLSRRAPLRPLTKFAYLYFIKLGLLDGAPGLTYCALQAIYEYFIVIKKRELRRRGEGRGL